MILHQQRFEVLSDYAPGMCGRCVQPAMIPG